MSFKHAFEKGINVEEVAQSEQEDGELSFEFDPEQEFSESDRHQVEAALRYYDHLGAALGYVELAADYELLFPQRSLLSDPSIKANLRRQVNRDFGVNPEKSEFDLVGAQVLLEKAPQLRQFDPDIFASVPPEKLKKAYQEYMDRTMADGIAGSVLASSEANLHLHPEQLPEDAGKGRSIWELTKSQTYDRVAERWNYLSNPSWLRRHIHS